MRPPDDPEVAAWLGKVRSDLRMAEFAVETDDPMWDQACYHAQQAAEKSLKGLMVAVDLEVPRTHVLTGLVAALMGPVPGAKDLLEHAAVLSAYGVAPRYPSFLAQETEDHAREALRCAHAVVTAVWALLSGPV